MCSDEKDLCGENQNLCLVEAIYIVSDNVLHRLLVVGILKHLFYFCRVKKEKTIAGQRANFDDILSLHILYRAKLDFF